MSAAKYKRTSRAPIVVDGVTFESYRTGINQYALFVGDPSERRAVVRHNFSGSTYQAQVNGQTIGKRYRTEEAAMRAAAKALKAAKGEA